MKHRHWIEDDAKRKLGEANRVLHELKLHKETLKRTRAKILEERRESKNLEAQLQLAYSQYDGKLKDDIRNQNEKIAQQLKVVEEQKETLKLAMKERKKLEQLEKRQFETYQKEVKRKEISISDEAAKNFVKQSADKK